MRRHPTNKPTSDPTYSLQWSGVTTTPRVKGKVCERCGGGVYKESDSTYCPTCDDYVTTTEETRP